MSSGHVNNRGPLHVYVYVNNWLNFHMQYLSTFVVSFHKTYNTISVVGTPYNPATFVVLKDAEVKPKGIRARLLNHLTTIINVLCTFGKHSYWPDSYGSRL